MATNSKSDPLTVLDQMFKDVLVQTGKAVKATAKEGPGATRKIRKRRHDSTSTYHFALDDLENEIIKAKSVLIRDLERLRAARLPAPAPAPAPVPSPVPPPQTVAPQGPAAGLPSAAAHTTKPPPFVPNPESKPVAPFPDMGTGDVVDLTLGEKKPSPRNPPVGIKPTTAQRSPSLLKSEVKPSPKAAHRATPKGTPPAKVTPVPPPQIPRLQPPPPAAGGQAGPPPGTQPQAQRKQPANQMGPRGPGAPAPPAPHAPQAPQAPQASQVPRDAPMGPASGAPPGVKPGGANGAPKAGGLNFTDMQFSLAPSVNGMQKPQNAPPAPMPEFDLTTFAPQGGNNNNAFAVGNFPPEANPNSTGPNGATHPPVPQPPNMAEKPDTNLDDLFNLDNGSGADNMDLDLDLGADGAGDSNFDELFAYTNDTDMGQFDNAYFGLDE